MASDGMDEVAWSENGEGPGVGGMRWPGWEE